jgi:hypothetical protein
MNAAGEVGGRERREDDTQDVNLTSSQPSDDAHVHALIRVEAEEQLDPPNRVALRGTPRVAEHIDQGVCFFSLRPDDFVMVAVVRERGVDRRERQRECASSTSSGVMPRCSISLAIWLTLMSVPTTTARPPEASTCQVAEYLCRVHPRFLEGRLHCS